MVKCFKRHPIAGKICHLLVWIETPAHVNVLANIAGTHSGQNNKYLGAGHC